MRREINTLRPPEARTSSATESHQRAAQVKREALALGFQACGIAAAAPIDPEDRLGQWLGRGFHADMRWMAETKALRQDVRLKLPAARSVVVLAKNYYAERPEQPPGTGRVARYAWGRDYHKVLKKPLLNLARMLDTWEPDAQSFVSVDSAPVMERSWAARAGLGWIGKNSLVLRRDLGSWFFLGTVVTTVELAPDDPMDDHCGSCTACIDACPTGAIVEPQVVDARQCISYHTIENRGEIPAEVGERAQDWVFGCDICQEVCPWNRFVQPHAEPDFFPRAEALHPVLEELAAMSADEFDLRYAGSPIRRAKAAGLTRNARMAQENLSAVVK